MPFSTSGPSIVCLSHSPDFCTSASAKLSPVAEVILQDTGQIGIGVAVAVIVIWIQIIIKKKGGGSFTEYKAEVTGYDPGNPHNYPTNQCLGAWGQNADVHLGSCSSAHGIYWQAQCQNSSCTQVKLWNTYDKGYLTTGQPADGHTIWVSKGKPGDWQTWSAYTA
jgi:hypothetical protein